MQQRRLRWPLDAHDAMEFRGCWIALDNCHYNGGHLPVDGEVVDSDPDLAELCGRLHDASRSKCIVLFCDSEVPTEVRVSRD